MLQIPHLLGKALGIPECDLRALVGRAIVYEQELHVLVRLGEDAIDRLLDELRGVQEGDDAGNQWHVTHPISITSQPSNHLPSCFASPSPLQFRAQTRGNCNGSLDLPATSAIVEHAHANPAWRTI